MRIIATDAAPTHLGPVPQAVEAGGWLFISALMGSDPVTGELPPDAASEAARVFGNLDGILAAAGGRRTDVVRVGIYMTDLQGDRPDFNRAWVTYFGDHRPARAAVGVTDLGRPGTDTRFMVEVIAYLGEHHPQPTPPAEPSPRPRRWRRRAS